MRLLLPLLFALALLPGCNRGEPEAPPRLEAETQVPVTVSRVRAPISAELSELARLLEREVPVTLWSIDQQEKACVPAQRITICLKHTQKCKGSACTDIPCKVGVKHAKNTSDLSCRIVGTVKRGPIRLHGEGEIIHPTMPVSAEIAAEDVGKVLSETATAEAEVRAQIRPGLTPDWQPTAKVDIDYDWTQKPGIELPSQRITFANRADPKLQQVIARLEQRIPREVAKLHPRDRLEALWKSAFTSLELNRKNPPVWMRLTPQNWIMADIR